MSTVTKSRTGHRLYSGWGSLLSCSEALITASACLCKMRSLAGDSPMIKDGVGHEESKLKPVYAQNGFS